MIVRKGHRRAQAVVEVALILPLLLVLALGAVGIGRVALARMALDAITREAARAAALSPMPPLGSSGSSEMDVARSNAHSAATRVADGYGYGDGDVGIDITFENGQFGPGSWVRADGSMQVHALHVRFIEGGTLPGPIITVDSSHWERVDQYRSRPPR